MTERAKTGTWASALAAAALMGAAGLVARAALTEAHSPLAAARPHQPAPGRPEGAAPSTVAPSASPADAPPCVDSDCACRRRQALERLEGEAGGAESFLMQPAGGSPSGCAEALAGARVEALARAGRCAEARAAAVAVAERSLGEVDYALALCAFRAGNPGDARKNARAAIVHGRQAAGHLLLGAVALGASELDEAERELAEAVRLAPRVAEAHYQLGVVLHQKGRYNKARAAYLEALRLEPRYHDARHRLVLLTAQASAMLEARHHLDELRRAVGPNDERVKGAEAFVHEQAASGRQPLTLPGSR